MGVAWIAVFLNVCVFCGFQTCPKNCKLKKPLLTCNEETSVCTQGCINGYYGKTCNMTCDDNCKKKTCQQGDGSCICKDGYKFNTGSCLENKGVKCKSDNHCLDKMCISAGREECLRGCMLGWFGSDCKKACTDPRSETCGEDCKTELFGPKCEVNCSQHCVSGCHQLSGECAQCEAGWYGSTCQSECSAGCAGTYKDCDKDGTCTKECVKGYYGEKCEATCPEGCFDDVCDLNGTCNTCKPGSHGTLCRQTCKMCVDGFCDMRNGKCTKGCRSGYYGTVCDLACVDCKGANCDRQTGECKGTMVPYIIGGGVIFVVIVLAVVVVCYSKRMRDIVKDGVDPVAQNTAVQFFPRAGTQLRSVEVGNSENDACWSSSDDTYNHLFDIKAVETAYSIANDDLESYSGYCAVRPLFRGICDQLTDEDDDRSSEGSGRECASGGSLNSLFDVTRSDRKGNRIDAATASVEGENNPEPMEIVVSNEEKLSQATIKGVTLISDEEAACDAVHMEGEVEATWREERACGSVHMEDKDVATWREEALDRGPDVGLGKQETERDNSVALTGTYNVLNNDGNDLITSKTSGIGKEYVEVIVLQEFEL